MSKKTNPIADVCKKCGSENIYQDAWVSVADGSVVATFDNFFCPECGEECSVIKKGEFDDKVRRM